MSAGKNNQSKTKTKTKTKAADTVAVAAIPDAPKPKPAGRKRQSPPIAEPEMYFNREWSWLDFNSRVLALASTASIPLLERVKFLAITATNLDEFFMVRVAGLKELVRAGTRKAGADGFSPVEQLEGISRRVREMANQQARLWIKDLQPQLARAGIEVVTRQDLSEEELGSLRRYFVKQVLPVLTPMAVDPAHPFPHLPNKSLSLCVMLRTKDNGRAAKPLYAFVEIPTILPRFVPLKQTRERARFILLGEVISLHIDLLFPGSKVIETFTLRVTRDSDLEIDEEEAEDLLKVIEKELRQRQWGNVVRLEISSRAPAEAVKYLLEMLDIEARDVVSTDGPLNYGDWMALARLSGYEDLRYPPFTPQVRPQWMSGLDIFDLIAAGDRLVHHPYESFATVAEFIESAATDPQVLAIKMTLYRTSPESPIMRSLIKAANNGKQVVALVELKARFDEANNIQWARLLEREGVHVVYGIVGLKTHCKASLVVRREGKQLRRYCHLGTGNYNSTTAGIYTDLGLFTADPAMCEDVANLFNMLTGFANPAEWKRIVPSPKAMHERLLQLIRNEIRHAHAGQKAGIICKMNSLVDPAIIAALYEASKAGVNVDLIVRGICCLRPGVPGVSERIRVISIVGRFLEHSRIFYFSQGGDPLIYLSSADWMQRNFFSRIEVMFPVDDPDLRRRITDEILAASLNDNVNAWELRQDGTWKRRTPPSPGQAYDSHQRLIAVEEKIAAQTATIKGLKQ